jgi:CMP/dCMP kinase
MNYKQVLKAIQDRDNKDARLEKINRAKLLKLELKLYKPKRVIAVNTGKIEGVDKVAQYLKKQLKKSEKIITLEGVSGSGKSSTAGLLADKIGAIRFSFGELFRYLTYLRLIKGIDDLNPIFLKLRYRYSDSKLSLWHDKKNVTKSLDQELRDPKIEALVPKVAEVTQKQSMELFAKEITLLADTGHKIIIEGRAFTLDFLPSDVRIKLQCAASVRAKRRLKQMQK